MPKRLLAIGVGGTGKACLTILKERLEESYGCVPDSVVLLSLDTDDLRYTDQFSGTQLNPQTDERGREPEFRHIVSRPGVTMDTIFADIASGRSTAYMHWLEKEKLARVLSPSEKDIRGGAQRHRPIGRLALFQRWDNPVYSSIVGAITRMYGDPDKEQPMSAIEIEQSKRQIFIIGSVAGGTGSGFIIDVANLVHHAIISNSKWQSIDTSAIIALPDTFSSCATTMNDPTNLKPNTYAALRELDRFMRTHSNMLPYMVRYGEDLRSITWSTNRPLDHVYLVDTTCPSAASDMDLSGDPMRGVFPLISDFVMAHIDQTLGDALASIRSNAGMYYDKEEGWQYSSFNVYTYILPVDDIIESFSYRFLRELLQRQYLPIPNKKVLAQVELAASKEVVRIFSDSNVSGRVNPGIVQKAIAATRGSDPEYPDMSWSGLFNMIALSEGAFAEDYKTLQQWLDYLSSKLIPSKEGEYKHEDYDEGYTRLIKFSEQFIDDCLGPQYDPDNEEAREGGEWDIILARYRDALRSRFAEALDAEIMNILNRRDPRSKILVAAQLPTARAVVAALKDRLVSFKTVLQTEYEQAAIETQLHQASVDLRNAIAWMQDTKDTQTWKLFGKPEARKAQDMYISCFYEKIHLLLHRRMYRVVLDVLDALGASEKDQNGNLSVVDQAAHELWLCQDTLQETSKILQDWSRIHENNRSEKRQIKVRRYITNPEFEDQLYKQPEHVEYVAMQVLGEVLGAKGITWERKDDTVPLDYKIVSMWSLEDKEPEGIARQFFIGVKELFQVVRENVSIADRIAVEFKSHSYFTNVVGQINEPFLRYNPSINGKSMGHERYVSFNLASATKDEAREILERARVILRDQGRTVDIATENNVACTVIEVARGVKLHAVEQFLACENDYRGKLDRGRESLHLFPEEQIATNYESIIESLGEPNNRMRPFSPELVVAMGDEDKLRFFTLACAFGLIEQGIYRDEEGNETTEVYLNLESHGGRRLRLSETERLRVLDPKFDIVGTTEQTARRYLNALQNFVLKVTQKPGVPNPMILTLVDDLTRFGVSLGHIQSPFSLMLRTLNAALRATTNAFGPTSDEEPDLARRNELNAQRRIEKLRNFLNIRVAEFKGDERMPLRIRDMGTLMHLILNREIQSLLEIAGRDALTNTIFWKATNFFMQAGFVTNSDGLLPNEVIIHTSRRITHSKYGNVLVKAFPDDLNGSHLRKIEERITLTRTYNKLIYVVHNGKLPREAFAQMHTYKMEGLTVVPIPITVVSDALASPNVDCYFSLKSLEQKYLGRFNYYDENNAIEDPNWFFGRLVETDEIIARLKAHQHAGIFGMRKIGKSSLLSHLRQRLAKESVPVASIGLQSGSIDPQQSLCEIIQKLGSAIKALGVQNIPESQLLKTSHSPSSLGQVFKNDIRALWDIVRREIRSPIMVVTIDEAERLLPQQGNLETYQKYDSFFAPIRDLSQNERCLLSVVTAEQPSIRAEFDPQFGTNTMFELYDERYLSCFNYEECEDMIVTIGNLMSIEYSPESLQRIFAESGGHPYIARALCACIANDCRAKEVAVQDVDAAINTTLGKLKEYFRAWQKKLSDVEQEVVVAILKTHALPPQTNDERIDACEHLQKQGIIYQNESRQWNMTIQLLKRWLEPRVGV